MEETANMIFYGLGKCLAEACWLAAGKQPKLKVICPKAIKYGHLKHGEIVRLNNLNM